MNARHLQAATLALVVSVCCSCGTSPSAPTSRDVLARLEVTCAPSPTAALKCTVVCAGSCGGLPTDATGSATWSASPGGVVYMTVPGEFIGVGVGDVKITADLVNMHDEVPVSVFPGTAPLQTTYVWGDVFEEGKTALTGGVPSARIELLDGPAAGRFAVSGQQGQALPGYYTGPASGGRYYLHGIPSGRTRLRISKDGYETQERDVTIDANGGQPQIDVALRRQ